MCALLLPQIHFFGGRRGHLGTEPTVVTCMFYMRIYCSAAQFGCTIYVRWWSPPLSPDNRSLVIGGGGRGESGSPAHLPFISAAILFSGMNYGGRCHFTPPPHAFYLGEAGGGSLGHLLTCHLFQQPFFLVA